MAWTWRNSPKASNQNCQRHSVQSDGRVLSKKNRSVHHTGWSNWIISGDKEGNIENLDKFAAEVVTIRGRDPDRNSCIATSDVISGEKERFAGTSITIFVVANSLAMLRNVLGDP